MKKVRVIFSPEAEEVYKYLNEQAKKSTDLYCKDIKINSDADNNCAELRFALL